MSTNIGEIDICLRGGLALGALHEIAATDFRAIPSAWGFLLALMARVERKNAVVWPLVSSEPFGMPYACGLKSFGLNPGDFLMVRCRCEHDAAWAMEEALRVGARAVIGARTRDMDLTASRRLQLAAQRSGTPIFLLRTHDDCRPSAAVSRWRVAVLPAARDRFGLFSNPRWHIALEYARGGRCGEWVVEWNHETLCLRLPSILADRAERQAA
ncbi:MAG: ImuA protein [Alphaproteobacteria bacterium]|nr:ImuA protein [Alphaproteobacteria bacterium]MDE2110551.1 ImuA protein [Alphaproteobacteria bacterium]MDE2492721.1 ImuA protein [Alphaproteobacteria bacterium]